MIITVKEYFKLRDALANMELIILRILNFDLSTDLIHIWVAAFVHDLSVNMNERISSKDKCKRI